MYKVLIDNEILSWSNTEETALLSAILTLEANKAGTFVFSLAPNHPKYNAFVFRQSIIDVYQDADLIFEGVPVSEETNFDNVKTVTCEGELTFLNDTIQRPAKYTGQTVTSFLTALLSEHNADCDASKTFTLGTVTVNGGSALYRYTNYESTMSEIAEDLVENLGGYLRVRHSGGVRYLDYLASSPHTSSQIIKIGYNLLDLSKNYSSVDICTMLIPLGATIDGQEAVQGIDKHVDITSVNGGLDYLTSTASATYGKIWRTVVWDGINDPSTLLSTATAYLTDAQWSNMVLEARAFDLGLARSDVEQFRLLDEIRVVSAPHGLDRYFLLTKLELNLNDPAQTMITLGEETFLPISAASAKTSAEVENQNTQMQVIATQHARDLLENATGGCVYFRYDPQGVLYEIDIMNTNDPLTATKMWRWNINGWGYSDDGGQTYTIAATMDGEIDANFIKTGTLDANRIAAGSITLGKLGSDVTTPISNAQSTADSAVANMPVVNLLPQVYATAVAYGNPYTKTGVTFTVNNDGSITVTGTNTSSAFYYYLTDSRTTPSGSTTLTGVRPIRIDSAKQYKFSGCPEGGGSSSYRQEILLGTDGDSFPWSASETGSGVTTPIGYKYAYFRIRIGASYAFPEGGVTFYPMLTTGTASYTYQRNTTVIDAGSILTGYINANRIDANSITISKLASDVTTPISNAQTTADSAVANTPVLNLMPNVYCSQSVHGNSWTTNGLTFVVNADRSITVTGTNTSSNTVSYYLFDGSLSSGATTKVPPLQIDPNKKYYISGCPSGGSSSKYFLGIYRSTDGSSWTAVARDTGSGYTVAAGYNYIHVRIIIGGSYACPQDGLTFYPMLTTGDTAHAYQQNSTVIDGDHIRTGTLDASNVNVVNLNADNITAGALVVKDSSSRTLFSASLASKAVSIGGWTVNQNSIYNGTWGTANAVMVCTGTASSKSIGGSASISGWCFTAGTAFGVTKAGVLYANSAHIQGEITATSGAIGGWTVGTNKISSNSGNTYISSNTSDYAFKATNTVIAHNGDISTTGKLILSGDSGYIELGGLSFIQASNGGLKGRVGHTNNHFIFNKGTAGIQICLNGTTYNISNVNGYLGISQV